MSDSLSNNIVIYARGIYLLKLPYVQEVMFNFDSLLTKYNWTRLPGHTVQGCGLILAHLDPIFFLMDPRFKFWKFHRTRNGM